VGNSGDQYRESRGEKDRRRRKQRRKQKGSGRKRIGRRSRRKEKL